MAFNRWALSGIRLARGMTKSQLAVTAQISNAYLTELELGDKTKASAAVVRKLADALQVDPRALDIDFTVPVAPKRRVKRA